jgi:hypothetical protein
MIYPVFRPTEYLYNTHGKQDKPKWEIYGDAVREVMCEQSGMKPNDQPFTEMQQYWKSLTGKTKTDNYMFGDAKKQ